jgi:putative ATP-binding cassette transporter
LPDRGPAGIPVYSHDDGPRGASFGKGGRGMTFINLFGLRLANVWQRFVVLAALSGLSNAAVLATINAAAAATERDVQARSLVTLVLAIAIYSVSQKALMVAATQLAETTVNGLRKRFIERLQAAGVKDVEKLDRSVLYTCIGGEMQVLSDGTLTLVIVIQALVLLTVTVLYLAFLSFTALILAGLFSGIAASFHVGRSRQIRERLATTFKLETRLLDGFTDFVEGFKEVKLNAARSADLARNLRRLSSEVAETRQQMRSLTSSDFVASHVAFFLLTGLMVFAVPLISTIDHATIVKITTSSLFLIGPITTLFGGLPVMQRLNAAAETILATQQRISELGQEEVGPANPPATFETIGLRQATFTYDINGYEDGENRGFKVGPIDLTIKRGQVIFITGGNGSGKSTLLKLLTGLYPPTSGEILLDGEPVPGAEIPSYRELFSAIFSDNHLFRQLYGVPEVDAEEADRLFELMELGQKTRIVDRAFETVALSSGQRKRLAMIALLLEHRPICIFDEWAADQDPHFRQKFYRTIIPQLVAQGKTVIAVTHDERYFDVADWRIHLAEGQLQSVAPAPANADC